MEESGSVVHHAHGEDGLNLALSESYDADVIDIMLEISETEAGIAGTDREEVDMADVVQGACELFRPITEEKGDSLPRVLPDHRSPLPFFYLHITKK